VLACKKVDSQFLDCHLIVRGVKQQIMIELLQNEENQKKSNLDEDD